MGAIVPMLAVCDGKSDPGLGVALFAALVVAFLVLPVTALVTARPGTRSQVLLTALVALAAGALLAFAAFSGGGGDNALSLAFVSGAAGAVIGVLVPLLDKNNELGEFVRSLTVGVAASVAPFAVPVGLLIGGLAISGSCLD